MASNYEKRKEYHRKYREEHRERYIAFHKEYRKNPVNKAKLKRRKETDVNYKLKLLLRTRLRQALNGNYKSGSAIQDLGCSIEQFKKYIESKFTEGMSWNNHGQFGWHIDHIKPLTSFDLTNRKQLLEACHYTNLQPLWWQDNVTKGNKQRANS